MVKTFKQFITETETIDFETYASRHGGSRQDYGDAAMHKTSKNVSARAKKAAMNQMLRQSVDLQNKRGQLSKEYNNHIASEKIKEPSHMDIIRQNAQGHPDNKSTQAALRVLAKRAARAAEQK